MVQNAADVIARDIGQAAVAGLIVEERRAVLPQRLVRVHTGAIIAGQRLGHKRCRLAILYRRVLDDVLERLNIIRRMQQRIEAVVDLLLAAAADLVVVALNRKTCILQVSDHLITDIHCLVIGRGGEVATLHAHLRAQVRRAIQVGRLAAVPPAFIRVHLVETRVGLSGIAHRIKQVELCLRAEVTGICNTGRCQVFLRLARDIARITRIWLQSQRIMHEELHVQRLFNTERIQRRRRRIWQQRHV